MPSSPSCLIFLSLWNWGVSMIFTSSGSSSIEPCIGSLNTCILFCGQIGYGGNQTTDALSSNEADEATIHTPVLRVLCQEVELDVTQLFLWQHSCSTVIIFHPISFNGHGQGHWYNYFIVVVSIFKTCLRVFQYISYYLDLNAWCWKTLKFLLWQCFMT